VGDRHSGAADLELALAGEDEAVCGADDRSRSDDGGGKAEQGERDEREFESLPSAPPRKRMKWRFLGLVCSQIGLQL